MKFIPLLFIASLFACSPSHSQNQIALNPAPISIVKNASYDQVQPYYMIDFSAAFCLFEIRVNDVLVFTLNLEGQTATMIPINAGILQSGKQQVSIKLLPLAGQKVLNPSAGFKYDIKEFDAKNNLNFKSQLPGEYAVAKVDPAKKQTVLTQTAVFNAQVPYTIKAHQTGKDLKSVTGLKDKLNSAYQQLAGLIAKGNTAQLKKMIANRESVAATTMYLSKEESDDRMAGLISNLKSGFKLVPIPANAVVKIFADGKMATLVRPSGESALMLKDVKNNEELTLDFSFYIPEGKTELEII